MAEHTTEHTTEHTAPGTPLTDPLRHHGDVEATDGLIDFAVNVHPGPRPVWLDEALRSSLDDIHRYPSPTAARAAVAARHGSAPEEVLVTAGAAEAFSLIARLRAWQCPVVVHPQFTEPHAALAQAGRTVQPVLLPPPFTLDPDRVPDRADLVVVGNPTNPTGVLHPTDTIDRLRRPGRLVVVDEAFLDCVGEHASMLPRLGHPGGDLVVIRSLTKHWSMPGVRAGYLLGPADVVGALARGQVPWSVSTSAAAATVACCTPAAADEAVRRARQIAGWREDLQQGLTDLGIAHLASSASFVLARTGEGVHARLRASGIAVRRADSFPGLDASWVRIAVRPQDTTRTLLRALAAMP